MPVICISKENPSDEDMQNLGEIMDKMNDALVEESFKLANELGIDSYHASQILYLRGRSRWTQDKENKLIGYFKAGKSVNVMEWDWEDL